MPILSKTSSLDSKSIAVLIPCYNEEITIKKVCEDFHNILPMAQIYVIDNNSTDSTLSIAKSLKFVSVLEEKKQGKGNVIRSAFKNIDADLYVMVDGDDTYPPTNIIEMLSICDNGINMVVGDRLSSTYFIENKRPFHNIGNILVRFLINLLWKSNVKDIMSGLRVFSKSYVKSFPITKTGFELETEMTIHALDNNLGIKEVAIDYQDRPNGSFSKLETYGDGFRVIHTIISLFKEYRPITFFGLLSILFLVPAFYGIGIGIYQYFTFGNISKMPSFIGGVFCFVTALLCFVTGIILDVLHKNSRKAFELTYINL